MMTNTNSGSSSDAPEILHSSLISKNITIGRHRTSVRLEPEMWQGLMEICRRERATLHEVCSAIAQYKTKGTSLTAAIRVFTMAYFRTAATEEGHSKAGHGQRLGHAISAPIVQTIMSASTNPSTPSSFMPGRDFGGGAKAVSY